MAILLELILSIIACIQLHVTMLNVHGEYSKYETIREYKALKAVIQSRDFFINGAKFTQLICVDARLLQLDPAIVWTISYY